MENFTSYEEYKDFVHEEWEQGYINELEQDGLIVEKERYINEENPSQGDINFRYLTEEEFNIKFKI